MNYGIIRYIIGKVIAVEGLFMAIPMAAALIYREWSGFAVYAVCTFLIVALGCFLSSKEPEKKNFYAREAYVMAALAWIIISVLGAVPFIATGEINSIIDAVFEITSGFTTTGASILADPSGLMKCNLLWRSFSHWLGGMGVLVFLLALMPAGGGESLYIMRAESTGPSVGKIVPRIRQTSKILYGIYTGLTIILFVLLIIGRMPVFDAVCIAIGTAGTGGFGVLSESMASYSIYNQVVVTVFMLLFGLNFSFYYLLLIRKAKDAFKMEEVRGYAVVYIGITILITLNLWFDRGGNFLIQLQQAAFQTSSIMTTTGFATQDFNLWPEFSKVLLGVLMLVGGCTGSTAGGIKISRILIYLKGIGKEIAAQVHPKRVKIICLDKKRIPDETLRSVYIYMAVYVLIMTVSVILVSLDGYDWETTFSSVLATLNNIGPGFGGVGPACNFSFFSLSSKIVLIIDMIAGRLELIPLFIIMMPDTWRRNG